MAITIQQQPGLWSPVYNPMVFILDSSNTGQSNFKYIADIYVSGVTGYTRIAIDPDPTYSQALVDVHRILESNVTSDPGLKANNGFQLASNSMLAYEVKFGEMYGAASAITTYPSLTVTGTKYAFNGAYNTDRWLTFNGAAVAIEDSGALLSDAWLIQRISYSIYGSADRYLHYITNTSGTVYFAEVKTYNSSGGLIQTAKIENPYQSVSSYTHRRQYFMSGTRAINAASLYSGSQPVIDSTVSYYTVRFTNFAGTSVYSPIYRYYVDDDCNMGRTPLTLHWKNKKGGFDSYEFRMINRYKTQTSHTTAERKLGTMTNNAWSYVASDAGRIHIDTKIQARYELQSDWISLDDSYTLMGLIESPEIYFDNGTDFKRVVLTSPTEAEYKSSAYGDNDLQSLKVTVELANEYWGQRG